MPAEGMGAVADLIAERLPLHRLWLEPDPDAWFAAWGPTIRAIASNGPQAPIDAAFMGRLPNLEIVASFGVGYDHIDAAMGGRARDRRHPYAGRARRRGRRPRDGADDHDGAPPAAGRALSSRRRMAEGRPSRSARRCSGRTMGILGLGRIGKAIAARADVSGSRSSITAAAPSPTSPYRFYPALVEMAKACDILMVAAPGGPGTRHIVDAALLAALGPDGVLINIARGTLVDEPALIEALRTGTILAAGLDVYENEPKVPAELLALDNAVLLPHVGSASVKTRRAMADCVAQTSSPGRRASRR